MIDFPDAKAPPNKMDQLVMGVDCARHPLITGCILGHGNGDPRQQVRNFLYSMHNSGQLTDDEYHHWHARLVRWEKANSVYMPPRTGCADHPEHRRQIKWQST